MDIELIGTKDINLFEFGDRFGGFRLLFSLLDLFALWFFDLDVRALFNF